ncbi:biotin/lipoate--protein ligase family protein [Meridianimarinicoccus aquatilis]|uniref:DUF4444 domain-containing protein n=1 Tax=Meridianimarinicoccus aquatilis TaxID=2552766 RepID=A0A4R6B1P4_9RHOB|nr:biotin/lipoate--protein ligase family protein [Fluviibacterium aquatile]TDL90587.1 DUF4444 domain-containing protein [Fluviibacterium aquatile]
MTEQAQNGPAPVFPPLFRGLADPDPFATGCAQARAGVDAGLVLFDLQIDRLSAAIVFAPEVPLADAAVMLPLCGVGFQNAFGAHAPPEVAVHLEWGGALRINGAVAGRLRMASDVSAPHAVPGWLVIGLELAMMGASAAPGTTPDHTNLFDEGCADVDPVLLLEAWVRHTLVWINRWADGDLRGLHAEWSGLVHGIGDPVAGQDGVFLGVDDQFGMLLKQEAGTVGVPLTALLEETQ